MRLDRFTLRIRRLAIGQSCASPPVNKMAIRRPLASDSAWIFVLRPPRERPTACFCSPISSKFPKQVVPDAAPCPTDKAVIDGRRRTVFRRAVAPAAPALQHVHDAADNAAIIHPLDTSDIRRQMRFNPLPLLVAEPEQVLAHSPDPQNESGHDGITIALPQQQN